MRIVVRLALVLLALGVAAIAALFSGLTDVGATTPHWRGTRWILATAMESSVRRHARAVASPADLGDAPRISRGAQAYEAMCEQCHGVPGAPPGVFARGMLPAPTSLADAPRGWSAAEQFWIVKHGIRMTGMPAFGPTHGDEDLWDVVAFLRALPALSAEAYRALVAQEAEHGGHEHEHEHEHGQGHSAGGRP